MIIIPLTLPMKNLDRLLKEEFYLSKLIYIDLPPVATFTLPATGCPAMATS
jgi:hypothetical protein